MQFKYMYVHVHVCLSAIYTMILSPHVKLFDASHIHSAYSKTLYNLHNVHIHVIFNQKIESRIIWCMQKLAQLIKLFSVILLPVIV